MKQTLVVMMLLLFVSPIVQGQASGAGQSNSVEQTVLRLEREKDEAYLHGDKAAIERLYADDYVGINARGGFASKTDIINFITIRGGAYDAYASQEITVRVFGDTAVATGQYSFTYSKALEGKDDNHYRYTHIYVKRPAGWQIVAAQFTRIDK